MRFLPLGLASMASMASSASCPARHVTSVPLAATLAPVVMVGVVAGGLLQQHPRESLQHLHAVSRIFSVLKPISIVSECQNSDSVAKIVT
jgi:hypothetical protein